MLTPYGTNIHDPWQGKEIGTERCAECNLTFALAETKVEMLPGKIVHANCLMRRLNRIGERRN